MFARPKLQGEREISYRKLKHLKAWMKFLNKSPKLINIAYTNYIKSLVI